MAFAAKTVREYEAAHASELAEMDAAQSLAA